MTTQQFAFPLDLTGKATTNLITGERHTITPAAGRDYRVCVPTSGPFFLESVIVKHVQSGRILQLGIDWVPGWKFESASDSPPYPSIYGTIVLVNGNYTGATLELQYQTLGGQYVLNANVLTTILANMTIDPRVSTWENVTEVPGQFIADPHLHHIQETKGYDDLVAAITNFATTYRDIHNQSTGTLAQHLAAQNPHKITAQTIGLERFVDVRVATMSEYTANNPNAINYVTPALLRQVFSSQTGAATKAVSSESRVFDTVIASNAGQSWMPNIVHFFYQPSISDPMQSRGRFVKTATGVEIHASSGTNASTTLHSQSGALLGGFRCDDKTIGLVDSSNNWLGYFNAQGVFQHNGMNRLSDARLKENLALVDTEEFSADQINFYKWVWANDVRVGQYLRGKSDSGVLAQEVMRVWPDAVQHDVERDVYTVDDGKVALRLALIAMKRTAPKKRFLTRFLDFVRGK